MAATKDLYLHLLNLTGDIIDTILLPKSFGKGGLERDEVVKLATAATPSAENHKFLSDVNCRLFLDDENTVDDIDHLLEYPDGGDLYARVVPKGLRIINLTGNKPAHKHQDPTAISEAAAEPAEPAEPKSIYVTYCTSAGDKTFRYDGYLQGETTFGELRKFLEEKASLSSADVAKLFPSLDGEQLFIPKTLADKKKDTAHVSEDDDVFFMPLSEVKQPEKPKIPPPAALSAPPKAMEGAHPLIILAQAKQAKKQGLFRRAITHLEAIQKDSSTEDQYVEARTLVAQMYFEGKRGKLALEEMETLTDQFKNNPYCHVELGDLCQKLEKYSDACDAYKSAITLMTRGKVQNEKLKRRILVDLGGCTYMVGKERNCMKTQRKGIDTVQKTNGESVEQVRAVLWMSRFYVQFGKAQYQNALTAACRCLAMSWENPVECPDMKEYRKNLVDIMGVIKKNGEDPVDVLKKTYTQGSLNTLDASMWAYFATCTRDHGHIEWALRFNEFVTTLGPKNPAYLLQYAHALENVGDHIKSLQVMVKGLKQLVAPIGVVYPQHVLRLVQETIDSLYATFPARDLEKDILPLLNAPRPNLRYTDEKVTLFHDYASTAKMTKGTSTDSPLVGEGSAVEEGISECKEYTEEQLNLLAVYFTIVKNLYIVGALQCLPELIQLLNPLRVKKNLHRTLIRNEHAYFLTIAALMQHHDYYIGEDKVQVYDALEILYVCGDSHSLSPSWQQISIGGVKTLIVNAIVTGMKVYHMRETCQFYPKKNFDAIINSCPKNANIMLLFGEIDCREGLLQCVEKGTYENVEEALSVLADIYLKQLGKLKKKFNNIYVHLPLPTLTVTTKLVLGFCKIIGARLEPHAGEYGTVYCHVVSPDMEKLLPQYELDMTHISPAYVHPLLEDAINNATQIMKITAQVNVNKGAKKK